MMTTRFPLEIELLVMMSAQRLGPDQAHAHAIAEDVLQEKGREVPAAEVEATLRLLEEKGFVSTRIVDPDGDRLGPARLVPVDKKGSVALEAALHVIRSTIDHMILEDGTFH